MIQLGRLDKIGAAGEEPPLPDRFPSIIIALICGVAALLSGCSNGGDSEQEHDTGARPTPADAAAIRDVDFNRNPDVQRMLSQVGSGRLEPGTVVYGDVTGDLREDALVPIASGGTLGNIAYLVFVPDQGGAELVLTRTLDRSSAGGLKLTVEGGVLIETAAVYRGEDPMCCPSALRRTTFRWDGSRLQVDREEQVSQTPGPKQ